MKFILTSLLVLNFAFLTGRPFVVGNLTGQLGNQFFVIAATYSLALDNDADPFFPDLVSRKEDNTQLNFEKIFFNLNSSDPGNIEYRYYEPYFSYTPITYKNNMSISGYFQSEKYFINNKNEIIKLFAPSNEISNHLYSKYSEIINNPKTVAIHVRSYLKEDPQQNYHTTLDVSYYEKAINFFPDDYLFIVCSNCPERCKKMFSTISRNFLFIEGEEYHHDFYLMSLCKHNIIANSTFSWWSAYLNRNEDKIVIAPKRWFNPAQPISTKDLYPSEWILME